MDDFQSDDVYDDEYETSQNTLLNGGDYNGTQIIDSRADLDDDYSIDGEDHYAGKQGVCDHQNDKKEQFDKINPIADSGAVASSRDNDDQVSVDCSMEIDAQTSSRPRINDGRVSCYEINNFRDGLKTNEAPIVDSTIEPSIMLVEAGQDNQPTSHVTDLQICSHSADIIRVSKEQVQTSI